jgi:hypothetical protein
VVESIVVREALGIRSIAAMKSAGLAGQDSAVTNARACQAWLAC